MATDVKTEEGASVTRLVSGIIHDAQALFAQELELFRRELRADLQNIKVAVIVLIVGAAVGLVAAVLLGFAMVFILGTLAPALPLWACYAIIGGIFALICAGVLGAGFTKLRAENSLPEQSVEALKENFQWKTNTK
jgi:hypothetical protein